MRVRATAIPDVRVVEPKVFGDERGFFYESYNRRAFQAATGLDPDFVQDNHGPRNYLSLLVNRARMEGFVVFDYAERFHLAVADMAAYLKDGRLKSREDVVGGGVEAFPDTLLRLFSGENFGKLVLKIAD